uniref:Beta-glucosidase n=1 Tax=Panagrolaimus sp. ES5 TaxID=591445 RepID=A0AC34GQ84_9BILA
MEYTFPKDFKFGIATSAFQIEGASNIDGKGASIWDIYCHKPGNVKNDETADISCDSYHNWERDIQMIKEVGINFYRFSISWPRIFPDGTEKSLNQKGVEFYDKLINKLIEEAIEPVVTIFHWDLPQALQDMGGFLDSAISEHYKDYANFLFSHFGDRVKTWITVNEPLSVAQYGHCGQREKHAPGNFSDNCEWTMYLSAQRLLQCHLKAAKLYNEKYRSKQNGKIGITLSGCWYFPKTDSDEDQQASERAFQFSWGWFANPIFSETGDYPQIMKDRVKEISINYQMRVKSRLPEFTNDEIQDLKNSADFLGINYYFSLRVCNRKIENVDHLKKYTRMTDVGVILDYDPAWKIINGPSKWLSNVPEGLGNLLQKLSKEYKNIPILITENGAMDSEGEGLNDTSRIQYLSGHLAEVSKAIKNGINLIGYTVWSLMDNFEWSEGYSTKFGLFHVDFNTKEKTRTPKKSVEFYSNLIKTKYLRF